MPTSRRASIAESMFVAFLVAPEQTTCEFVWRMFPSLQMDITYLSKPYAGAEPLEDFFQIGTRAMASVLHRLPFTKHTLQTFIDNCIQFPFDFVLFQPRVTNATATVILLKAGTQTCETVVKSVDCILSDDPIGRRHLGEIRVAYAPMVHSPQDVCVVHEALDMECTGGPAPLAHTMHTLWGEARQGCSLYVAMVPVGGAPTADSVDMTGPLAYPGVSFYHAVWGQSLATSGASYACRKGVQHAL